MVVCPCPDRSRLADYLIGNVSVEELESIAGHLETCTACGSSVEELEPLADPLMMELRQADVPNEFCDEPQLNNVLARLRTLPVGGPSETTASIHRLRPGTQIGVYRIDAVLGDGGMGVVYRAWHTQLDRAVALKLLPKDRLGHPEAVARFRQEMKAVGRLDHPNLVKAHDAGEENGVPFLAMEFLEGLDASRVVHRLGPLPCADACELVRQAAEGLEYASCQGIVHRDVKPSNLMLTANGVVKVLDLGLAKLVHRTAKEEISQDGELLGTLEYMAPERLRDGRQADSRGDVYSLGCTLYKLLTGHTPFSDKKYDTAANKTLAIIQDPLPTPETFRPDLPQGLTNLIGRMLAKDREGRPATPGEVAIALRPFVAGADLAGVYERACAVSATVESVSTPHSAEPLADLVPKASFQPTSGRRQRAPILGRWRLLVGLTGSLAAAVLVTLLFRLPAAWFGPVSDSAGTMARPDADSRVGQRDATASPTVYAVAVLPFEDRSAELRLAAQLTDVVTARLGSRPEVHLVERGDLDRLRKEHQLNLSGAIEPSEAVRIGRLTGAKLLVIGSAAQIDKTVLLVAKVIGTESGSVLVASVDGTTADDLGALAGKLAERVADLLVKRATEVVPKGLPEPDRIAAIRKQLGARKRPSVWVCVAERHIGQPTMDPAAQTELLHLCRQTGFTVLDASEASRKQADVLLEGEAFSELAGRHGDLVSVKARVELKAVDRKTGHVIDAERQTEVVVDLAERVAGKSALQQAAGAVAQRLLPKLVKSEMLEKLSVQAAAIQTAVDALKREMIDPDKYPVVNASEEKDKWVVDFAVAEPGPPGTNYVTVWVSKVDGSTKVFRDE